MSTHVPELSSVEFGLLSDAFQAKSMATFRTGCFAYVRNAGTFGSNHY